jgi:hypothetical protein
LIGSRDGTSAASGLSLHLNQPHIVTACTKSKPKTIIGKDGFLIFHGDPFCASRILHIIWRLANKLQKIALISVSLRKSLCATMVWIRLESALVRPSANTN